MDVHRMCRAAIAVLASIACGFSAAGHTAESVAIFVDGISPSDTGFAAQPARTTNYLYAESPIRALIQRVDPVQKQILWNGNLIDAKATRVAVDDLKKMICDQAGNTVDLVTHSLGTVIAYTALAELAGLPGTGSKADCATAQVVNFVTLASPLGRDSTLPSRFGGVSGIKIPPLAEVASARALRVTRWLNVWAVFDPIGGKIDVPSVVNVSFSLEQSPAGPWDAHSFPYQDASSVRMIADVIDGVHVRVASAPGAAVANAGPAATSSTAAGAVAQTIAGCPKLFTQPGLSGSDAALALGPARELDRANAIAKLAAGKQLAAPLIPDQIPAMLKGATGSYRAQAIAYIAPLLKMRMSGTEGALVLGTASELRELDRANAVKAIATGNCFGELGADAGLLLDGATGSYRAMAVSEIARYMKKGLPAAEAAKALGSAAELRELDRANAVLALVRERVPADWSGDAGGVLKGATGSYRAMAIAGLAPLLRDNLSGSEASAILGTAEELRELDRANAIRALMQAGRLKPGLGGAELEAILNGTSGSYRAQAIAALSERK
jgi:hypothetical protein